MAPSSKISIKVARGQQKKLQDAIDLVRGQYGALLDAWGQLSADQRRRVLGASPMLSQLLRGVVALMLAASLARGVTYYSQGNGNWSTLSNWDTNSGGGGSDPASVAAMDDCAFIIQANHAILMDADMSGFTNGIQTLTITSHATTPGTLYFANGTNGWLMVKTGYNIVGTNAATKGRLLANSNGTWGGTTALTFANKAVIDLKGTAKIDATYLDIALYATHPTNWFVETYKTAYSCADQTTGVNTSTGVITFGSAPPTAGTAVRIKSSGTIPTGLSADRIYYTRSVSGNTCKLSLQNSDPQIVIPTATGSGALTMYDGHTDTATKTLNVIQNVTGDAPWVTTANNNRVALCDIGPVFNDVQLDTLATINAGSLVLTTANVDSAQYPCARIYLVSRNVRIQSSTTSGTQPLVDYGAATHAGVFSCQISPTAGTMQYGYGISGGGGHTMSGIITNCSRGTLGTTSMTVSGSIVASTFCMASPTTPTITGTVCGGQGGVYQAVSGASLGGTVLGFDAGLNACTGCSFDGTILGCGNGSYASNQLTMSGTIASSGNGVSTATGNTVTGAIDGCSVGLNATSGVVSGTVSNCTTGADTGYPFTMSGTMTRCTTGFAVTQCARISGTVSYCTTAVNGGSGILNGATFTGNTTDISLVGGRWVGWSVTLGGSTQVANYLHASSAQADYSLPYAGIQDLAGSAEDIGVWTAGGTIKTNAGHTAHVLTAQDNDRDVWMVVPFRATSGQTVTVSVTGQLSGTSAWTDRPVYAIVDPTRPWKGANEVLSSSTQDNDTSSHNYTIAHSPTRDRELWFMVRAKGGNAGGTGTETCTFTYDISTGSAGGGGTRAYAGGF